MAYPITNEIRGTKWISKQSDISLPFSHTNTCKISNASLIASFSKTLLGKKAYCFLQATAFLTMFSIIQKKTLAFPRHISYLCHLYHLPFILKIAILMRGNKKNPSHIYIPDNVATLWGKKENNGYQLQQCFPISFFPELSFLVKKEHVFFIHHVFNPFQNNKFRRFHIERVCRRQF